MKTIITLSLVMTSAAFSQSLPRLDGYSWWKIPALKGALLVPNGWHMKEAKKAQTLGYFVTKTEITDKAKGFDTGLTLNVIKNFKKTKGLDPLTWAKQYRKESLQSGKLLDSWDKNMGPFKSIGFQSEWVRDGHTLITHQLFVVNPKTDTLYFYVFEAPKKDWNEAWKHGENMLKLLMIDDEV